MSILIKDMEMPESCYYCPFADGVWQKDKRCLVNGEEMPRDGRDVQQNHINCPLTPIPPNVINFDKPYTFTISWDGKQLKGNMYGSNI